MSSDSRFKWLKRGLFAVACLATFAALFIVEENYRGLRAWENYRRDAAARGAPVEDLADLAPPPIPDDQNTWATPLFNTLRTDSDDDYWNDQKALNNRFPSDINFLNPGGWPATQPMDLAAAAKALHAPDVLTGLQPYNSLLAEVAAAVRRPAERFALRYDQGPSTRFPPFSVMRSLGRLFALRAEAELAAGQPGPALDDTLSLLGLARALKDEPLLVTVVVRAILLNMAIRVAQDGLSAQCWNAAQLTTLQTELQRTDLLSNARLAARGEETYWNGALDTLPEQYRSQKLYGDLLAINLLRGAIYQDLISGSQIYEQFLLPMFDPSRHRLDPEKLSDAIPVALQAEHDRWLHPAGFSFLDILPVWSKVSLQLARTQTAVDFAILACALERFRLAHGHYPDSLDALPPPFIAQLPHDVITGVPYKYQRTGDGRFSLACSNWTQIPESKTLASYASLKSDDLVWNYSKTASTGK